MNQAIAFDEGYATQPVDPITLTIMAYDNIIEDMQQAKNAWLDQAEGNAIQRNQHAQDLITELLLGLDYERGEEVARNLSRLYDFALRQLVGMGASSDVVTYDHLINIFGSLREAWVQISPKMG